MRNRKNMGLPRCAAGRWRCGGPGSTRGDAARDRYTSGTTGRLAVLLRECTTASRRTYGSPRARAELAAQGERTQAGKRSPNLRKNRRAIGGGLLPNRLFRSSSMRSNMAQNTCCLRMQSMSRCDDTARTI